MAQLSPAVAYETDQLTGRDEPLQDALPYADAVMRAHLDRAVAEANAATGCAAPPDRARIAVIEALGERVSKPTRVRGRGLVRGFGYGTVGAQLETGPVDRLTFDGRTGLFSEVRLGQSPIVDAAGVCSTVQLAGVRVGTDKIDHFLVNGYTAWRKAERTAPIAYAVRTERTTLGWWTSDTFSYADIEADLDGYAFYEGLVGPDGLVEIGADGCAAVRAPFTWAAWVDARWDEVENPSVYQRGVQRAIDAYLDANEPAVCAAWQAWADPCYGERLAEALAADVPRGLPKGSRPRAESQGAARPDPYRLVERCGAVGPAIAEADTCEPDRP